MYRYIVFFFFCCIFKIRWNRVLSLAIIVRVCNYRQHVYGVYGFIGVHIPLRLLLYMYEDSAIFLTYNY